MDEEEEEDVAEEEDVDEVGREDESIKTSSFFQCVQNAFFPLFHLEMMIHFSFVH